jgi:hypothetical protein
LVNEKQFFLADRVAGLLSRKIRDLLAGACRANFCTVTLPVAGSAHPRNLKQTYPKENEKR